MSVRVWQSPLAPLSRWLRDYGVGAQLWDAAASTQWGFLSRGPPMAFWSPSPWVGSGCRGGSATAVLSQAGPCQRLTTHHAERLWMHQAINWVIPGVINWRQKPTQITHGFTWCSRSSHSLIPPENLHGYGGQDQALSQPLSDCGTGWCHHLHCKVFAFNLLFVQRPLLIF